MTLGRSLQLVGWTAVFAAAVLVYCALIVLITDIVSGVLGW